MGPCQTRSSSPVVVDECCKTRSLESLCKVVQVELFGCRPTVGQDDARRLLTVSRWVEPASKGDPVDGLELDVFSAWHLFGIGCKCIINGSEQDTTKHSMVSMASSPSRLVWRKRI